MWSPVLYFTLNCRNCMCTLTQIPATLGFLHLLESKDGNCTVAEGHSAVRCYSWARPNSQDVRGAWSHLIDHSSMQKKQIYQENTTQRISYSNSCVRSRHISGSWVFPSPKRHRRLAASLELHHQIAIFLLRHERSSKFKIAKSLAEELSLGALLPFLDFLGPWNFGCKFCFSRCVAR